MHDFTPILKEIMNVIHQTCLKPPISNGRAKEYSALSKQKYKHCLLLGGKTWLTLHHIYKY